MPYEPKVFIVDDDAAVRQSLSLLMKSIGLAAQTYSSADEFFAEYAPTQAGCLIVDVRMPGMSGLELQDKLSASDITIPIILITGHGDIAMATRAMKKGAIDFITKPFNDQELIERIREALQKDIQTRSQSSYCDEVQKCLNALTTREREVMELVVKGRANKQIAYALGLSEKTIEKYRSRVMEKMGVDSVACLVRKVLITESDGGIPAPPGG